MAENNKYHTLVALVQDHPGVLNRVVSVLRRRSFNIESIAVGHTEQPKLSRMTILVNAEDVNVEQVRKQLSKLIEVVKIVDITDEKKVERELALIKVKTTPTTRGEIINIVDIFRANIVDVAPDSMTVEVTGDTEKVLSLLNLLQGFGIKEVARTGHIAITRGGSGPLIIEEETKPARLTHTPPPEGAANW
jgi:acetolactate synthase-1/3 small subunit